MGLGPIVVSEFGMNIMAFTFCRHFPVRGLDTFRHLINLTNLFGHKVGQIDFNSLPARVVC